jgi:predicted transcriptional regulator
MAIELEAIQGIIKLKDEYTETLETVHKNLEKFGGQHASWVTNLVSGEALVATAFVAAGVVVGAELVKLGNEAEEVGATIGRMAMTFNVPVDALSDLRFAIIAAGGDFDTFGNSMFMFQKRLEDNSDAVDKGLQKLGLSVREIRELRPDEQFLKISDAVRSAGTDVNKSAVAFEIFGRQGREILPLLLKPLADLTEESEKLGASWSEKEVEAAKAFRFELTKLAAETEETWTVLGREVAPVTNELTIAWGRMKLALANVALTAVDLVSLKPVAGWLGDNALAAEQAAVKQDVINKAMSLGAAEGIKYGEAVKFVNERFAPLHESVDKAATKLEELRNQAFIPLTAVQESEILELTKFGVSLKDVAELTGTNVTAVKTYVEAHKEQEAAIKKTAAAAEEWAKIMSDLNSVGKNAKDTLDGISGTVVEAVKFYLQAGVSQGELAKAYDLTNTQIHNIDESLKSETETVKKAQKIHDDWIKTLAAVESGSRSFQQQIDSIDGSIVDWAEHLLQSGVAAKDVAAYYGLTDDQVKALEQDLQAASSATAQLAGANAASAQAVNANANAVKKLSSELTALSKVSAGGSFDVNKTNIGTTAQSFGLNQGDVTAWAKLGYSFSQILQFAKQGPPPAGTPAGPGPRIPGFEEGGVVMVGERGPEPVRLPFGSTVFPNGTPLSSTAGSQRTQVNHIYINDTLRSAANKVGDEILRKTGALFGTN